MVSFIIINYLFYVLGHVRCTSYIATHVVLAVMQNFQKKKVPHDVDLTVHRLASAKPGTLQQFVN